VAELQKHGTSKTWERYLTNLTFSNSYCNATTL